MTPTTVSSTPYATPPLPSSPSSPVIFITPPRTRRAAPSRLGTPSIRRFDLAIELEERGGGGVVSGSGSSSGDEERLGGGGSKSKFYTPNGIGSIKKFTRKDSWDEEDEEGPSYTSNDPFLVPASSGNNNGNNNGKISRERGRLKSTAEKDRKELDRQMAELGVGSDEDDEDADDFHSNSDDDDAGNPFHPGQSDDEGDHARSDDGSLQSDDECDDTGDVEGGRVSKRDNDSGRNSGRSRSRSRARNRRKKRNRDEEEAELARGGRRGLYELLPSHILSHPLALLPLLPIIPQSFSSSSNSTPSSTSTSHHTSALLTLLILLPIITGLSIASHVVLIYMGRYLGKGRWEGVVGRGMVGVGSGSTSLEGEGRERRGLFEREGGEDGDERGKGEDERVKERERWRRRGNIEEWVVLGSQVLQIVGSLGLIAGWVGAIPSILLPIFPPSPSIFSSTFLWTILPSLILLTPLIPTRHKFDLTKVKDLVVVGLVLPVMVFVVIGRAVEVAKGQKGGSGEVVGKIGEMTGDAVQEGLVARYEATKGNGISAGTAMFLLILFFTPHMHTLPIHSELLRESRSRYPYAWLGSTIGLFTLILPYILVPFYLLPPGQGPISPAGVFDLFPTETTDGWLNLARICMVVLILASTTQWLSTARETLLRGVGVEREGRSKAIRWLAGLMWLFVTGLACLGGWVARKMEVLGMGCVVLAGWLIPAVLFVKVFHLSIPLAIVFPSTHAVSSTPILPTLPINDQHKGLPLTPSMETPDDPALTALLARKERQLQKNRKGRRLWQDLIVLVGILPVGVFAVVWAGCLLFGFVE